jgi:hypothetical protein
MARSFFGGELRQIVDIRQFQKASNDRDAKNVQRPTIMTPGASIRTNRSNYNRLETRYVTGLAGYVTIRAPGEKILEYLKRSGISGAPDSRRNDTTQTNHNSRP